MFQPMRLEVKIENHINEAFRRSQEYFYSRMYSYALHSINLALTYDSYNIIYLHARALIYDKLHDMEEAMKDAEEVIKIKNSYVWAYDFLGYAHTQLKNFEIAKSYYRRALQFDPCNIRYIRKIGFIEKKRLQQFGPPPIDDFVLPSYTYRPQLRCKISEIH